MEAYETCKFSGVDIRRDDVNEVFWFFFCSLVFRQFTPPGRTACEIKKKKTAVIYSYGSEITVRGSCFSFTSVTL